MLQNRFKVPVIVVEPELNLQGWLVRLCHKLWSHNDVLPRSSGRELLTATKWLDCEMVLVRSSTMRADHRTASTILELAARGCHVVCVQDTSHEFSLTDNWISLDKMHFISYSANTEVLEKLLLSCRLDSIAKGEIESSSSVD